MSDSDGFKKNIEVVLEELKHWLFVLRKEHLPRFKTGTFLWGKSNYLHLAMNLFTETIRALPRTIAYSVVIYVLTKSIFWLIKILG